VIFPESSNVKRVFLLLGVLVIPGIVGAVVYWQRLHSVTYQLSQARLAMGTRHAGEILSRLVASHPDNAEVVFACACQQRAEGRVAPALSSLKRAGELGWPKSQIDREYLLVAGLADFKKTQPQLALWIDRHPDDVDALRVMALGYAKAGKLEKALALVTSVLARAPDDAAALCIRGKIRLQNRQLDQARPDLARAFQEGPDHPYYADARVLLAICLLDLGEFAEALRLFRESAADDPGNPKALFGVGRCSRFLNKSDDAAAAFEAVLKLRPDHIESYMQLAYVYEERGDLKKALATLENAATIDPYWYEVPFRMAKLLYALGEKERAAKCEARYTEMYERWMKRMPGQTQEDVFNPRHAEPAFPKDLLEK
jgi:tetratricopeptide (TPR) repeat protein